jgi:hypothetical protein
LQRVLAPQASLLQVVQAPPPEPVSLPPLREQKLAEALVRPQPRLPRQ